MGTTRKMGLRQIELGFSSFYDQTFWNVYWPISLWHGRTQFLGSTCTHSTTSWLGHEFSGLLLPQCLDISTLDKINNYIFQNNFLTSKSSGWTPLILQDKKKTFGFKTNKQCNCIWFYLKSLQQIQKSLNILDPIYK